MGIYPQDIQVTFDEESQLRQSHYPVTLTEVISNKRNISEILQNFAMTFSNVCPESLNLTVTIL